MPNPNEPSFARPSGWELRGHRIYDTLQEIADRQGTQAAELAARRLEYALKSLIEAKGGTSPVAQSTKVINGLKVEQRPASTKSAEQIICEGRETIARLRAAIEQAEQHTTTTTAAKRPTALSEIESLVEQRATATRRTTEQCYGDVLSDRPELYDRYNQELAAGVYAVKPATTTTEPRSMPVESLVLGTAQGHIRAGEEANIGDALQRVFRESPAAYAAWLKESRGA